MSVLTDGANLPGQLAKVLLNTYVMLDFQSDEQALRHARECLDTLIYVVLNALSGGEEVEVEVDLMAAVCNCCDRFLLHMHFGIMYDKLFRCCLRRLRFRPREATAGPASPSLPLPLCDDDHGHDHDHGHRNDKDLDELALRLVAAKTVVDKLDCLVRLLQSLSDRRAASEEAEAGGGGGGTDDLLTSLCDLVLFQMRANRVHWLAEFAYLTAAPLSRDVDGNAALGMPAYALVTLQQSIHTLYEVSSAEDEDGGQSSSRTVADAQQGQQGQKGSMQPVCR